MAGSPRLGAPLRHRETGGKVAGILKRILHFDLVGIPLADHAFERLLDIPADHEDHPFKTGAHRVEHRIVHHGFSGRPDFVELFEPAVAAAHSGGKNHKRQFHFLILFLL